MVFLLSTHSNLMSSQLTERIHHSEGEIMELKDLLEAERIEVVKEISEKADQESPSKMVMEELEWIKFYLA